MLFGFVESPVLRFSIGLLSQWHVHCNDRNPTGHTEAAFWASTEWANKGQIAKPLASGWLEAIPAARRRERSACLVDWQKEKCDAYRH
jgi:hypothetical protein